MNTPTNNAAAPFLTEHGGRFRLLNSRYQLTIHINILNLFGFISLVGNDDRLGLGWGLVQLEDQSVLVDLHVADSLKLKVPLRYAQITKNNRLNIHIRETLDYVLFIVHFQNCFGFFKGDIRTFEYAPVDNRHHGAIV